MRIELVEMGHRFQGTPRQILMQMKSLAPGAADLTLREYIEGNAANIARGAGVQVDVAGESDDELAESFIEQMLGGGCARRF